MDSFDTDRESALGRFYSDLLHELGEHAVHGGTAFGAGAVLKRVGRAHGVGMADRLPLPRPTREEQKRHRDVSDGYEPGPAW